MVLNHDRSYVRSLTMGIRVAMDHVGQMCKYSWPSALFTLFLPFPGIIFFFGQIDAILRRWTILGYVPATTAKALKTDILYATKREVFLFLLLLVMTAIGVLAFFLPIAKGLSVLIGALALILVMLVLLPLDYSLLRIAYSDRSLLKCLSDYGKGLRHFGSLFAFDLLGFIMMGCYSMLVCLPLATVLLVKSQASAARAIGDLAELPISFLLISVLAYIVSMSLLLFGIQVFSFSRCLLWGSIEEVPAESEMEGAGIDGMVRSPKVMA